MARYGTKGRALAKLKRTAFVNAGDRIRGLPQARRQRVEALASEMAAELHFCEIRKALSITQKDLAENIRLAQSDVSRFEYAGLTGVRIEMLERYVADMGGRLRLLAEMPDGTIAEIPLQNGKLVKSRMSVSGANSANLNHSA